MTKYFLSTTSLLLLLCGQARAQVVAVPAPAVEGSALERLGLRSEEHYMTELGRWGRSPDSQGLYVASLDNSMVVVDHNSDVAFNPASVIKVATSFTALDRFGADYRFETAFRAAGTINSKTRTLTGDLVLVSSGDPVLATADVNRMVQQVIKAGVTRVTGGLVVTGPFTYASYLTTSVAITRLERAFKKLGLRVSKASRRASATGTLLTSHQSVSLRDIVFAQNAHSNNQTAERLGEAVGGPKAVENFLVKGIGIAPAEVHVGRTSGLDYNRITPRATVQLLRHLVLWLNFRNLLPEDILPRAGMDIGTLHSRFNSTDYRGAVVGKTGTLPVTDGGVSALAGFLYTHNQGVLVFAIFNTKGSVNTYRALQDELLKDLISESGGAELSVSLRRSDN